MNNLKTKALEKKKSFVRRIADFMVNKSKFDRKKFFEEADNKFNVNDLKSDRNSYYPKY